MFMFLLYQIYIRNTTISYLRTVFFQFAKCFYIEAAAQARHIVFISYDKLIVLFQTKIDKRETLFDK